MQINTSQPLSGSAGAGGSAAMGLLGVPATGGGGSGGCSGAEPPLCHWVSPPQHRRGAQRTAMLQHGARRSSTTRPRKPPLPSPQSALACNQPPGAKHPGNNDRFQRCHRQKSSVLPCVISCSISTPACARTGRSRRSQERASSPTQSAAGAGHAPAGISRGEGNVE